MRWQDANNEQYADWDNDKVIEVANDRNEVRYQIDWAQSICGNRKSQHANYQRRFRIPSREIHDQDVAFDTTRPFFG